MPPHPRVAIIGTAPSWATTPWDDPGLHLMSLNDAYQMKGFRRADQWYDFHPLNRFYYPTGSPVFAHQIPAGFYCRPPDHLAWLATQQIPVYLHPDYVAQHPDAATWPHARPFPKAEIEAAFGRYFTSSPAWMMAHAILEGATELHIYGIHLATEHEYIEQRPNFEFLCGRVLGPGRVTTTIREGIRRYETADGCIVLPEASPILAADFQYAFDPRPRAKLEPLRWDLHRIHVKRERAIATLRGAAWWQPMHQTKDELSHLDAWAADVQEQVGRLEAASRWT